MVAVDGDVGEQQAGNAFALPRRGGGVVPDRGQVGDQLTDAGALGVGELAGGLLACLFVGVLGVVEVAQGCVPVGFEAVGDEPVGGVDGQVAAPGEVGVVAGAFDVGGAHPVRVGGALVEIGAGNGRADRLCVFDAVALTRVGGQRLAVAVVVAHRHPLSAAAA